MVQECAFQVWVPGDQEVHSQHQGIFLAEHMEKDLGWQANSRPAHSRGHEWKERRSRGGE